MFVCVYVFVCLSVRKDIFGPQARSLPIFVPVASVFLWQGNEIPRGKGQFWVFPIDNALYSMAFGTHTKTAEQIEMPFGMISGLGPRNSVLRESDDPRKGSGNFWENMCLKKPNTTHLTNSCSGVHTIGADASLQELGESIIGREKSGIKHRGRSLISTTALFQYVANESYSSVNIYKITRYFLTFLCRMSIRA